MPHPREGWQGHGLPRRPNISRRDALRKGGLAALLAAGGTPLLNACAPYLTGPKSLPLPRHDHPVRWPVGGNTMIADGLAPETGATLQIYNWVAYVNQACLNNFAKKYNCRVVLTTFNTMDEALAKLHSGKLSFDVFMGVTVDVLGQLIATKLIQPLNHSYLPNIAQAWSDFTNPFYDQGWQYTVPYTIYTTGISWRKDFVHEDPYSMANPWAMPWQSKYRGKVAILDDYREGISLGLMKNGIFDLNTTNFGHIELSRNALRELSSLVAVQINNNDYTQIPAGQVWIHHAWSGDMAAAASYMPKGVPVDVVGYWFPKDGRGPVANDTNTVLRAARNPVLAHKFLDYMLDVKNVLTNISFNGYMQPVTAITPDRLVSDGLLPKSLTSTAVRQSDFRNGLAELQLPVDADANWQQAWLEASNGI